jgi:Ras-related protein Rab-5C
MYYRGAQAALVVYDLTNTESLRRAKMWVRELRQVNANDMVIGLAGNKADLVAGNKRQIDIREVAEYAEENGLIHMETSAKRGDNVIEIFMSVAKQVAAKQLPSTLNKPKDAFPPTKSKESGSCCGGTGKSNSKS